MKSIILALVIAFANPDSSVADEPKTVVPAGYVQLDGDATTPYTELSRIALSQVTLRLSHEQADQISREVFGEPLEYELPEMPSITGPFIYRDNTTKQVVAYYCIGAMGYYEMVFLPTNPPTITETYFIDDKHKILFTTYADLCRNSVKQIKAIVDSLQRPAEIKGKKETEQAAPCNGDKPSN